MSNKDELVTMELGKFILDNLEKIAYYAQKTKPLVIEQVEKDFEKSGKNNIIITTNSLRLAYLSDAYNFLDRILLDLEVVNFNLKHANNHAIELTVQKKEHQVNFEELNKKEEAINGEQPAESNQIEVSTETSQQDNS